MKFSILSSRKSASDFSVAILCILVVIFSASFASRRISSTATIILMGIYILSILPCFAEMEFRDKTCCFYVVVWIAFAWLYRFFRVSTSSGTSFFMRVKYFALLFFIMPVYGKWTHRQKLALVITAIGSMLFAMYLNIGIYNRFGTSYSIKLYRYGYINVMSTQQNSAVMLMYGATFVAFLHSKNKWMKFFFLAVTIFGVWFALSISQKATLLVLTIPMLLFLGFYNRELSVRRFIYFAILLFLGVVLILEYEAILRWLSEVLNSRRLTVRLNSIIAALQEGDVAEGGSSLSSRYRLVTRSLETFVNNIFFGVGTRSEIVQVGGHSQFADALAEYGLVGGVMLFAVIRSSALAIFRVAKVSVHERLGRQLLILVITFFVRGCLGHIFEPSVGVQMFLAIPLLFGMFKEKSVQQMEAQEEKSALQNETTLQGGLIT